MTPDGHINYPLDTSRTQRTRFDNNSKVVDTFWSALNSWKNLWLTKLHVKHNLCNSIAVINFKELATISF